MKHAKSPTSVKILLVVTALIAGGLWYAFQDVRTTWKGVPPPPTPGSVVSGALGDAQLGYRMSGLTLQHLGDEGGISTPLTDYDYPRLIEWMEAMYTLDPRSDFVPMLAAYYFGATPDADDAMRIVDFLEVVGNDPEGEKWRWLAQAVFLARYKGEDTDRALDLAQKMAALYGKKGGGMPLWTLQMPAFILAAQGENTAARDLLQTILETTPNLSANEVNFLENRIRTLPKNF